MHLTNFELQLINDQREVYNNCRDILLSSIEIYKMHIEYMKDAIRYDDYECYAIKSNGQKRILRILESKL